MEHDPITIDNERKEDIRGELNFVAVDMLEQMRHSQHQFVYEQGAEAVRNLTGGHLDVLLEGPRVLNAARMTALERIEPGLEAYVETRVDSTTQPELHDGLCAFMNKYSIASMNDREWMSPQLDPAGNPIPGSSGKERAQAEFDEFCQAVYEERYGGLNGVEGLTGPAQERLDAARENLARISARRSRRSLIMGIKGDYSKKNLERARDEYNEALLDAGGEARTLLEAAGATPEQITQFAALGAMNMARELTETQLRYALCATKAYKLNDSGELVQKTGRISSKKAKFYDWWQKNSSQKALQIRGGFRLSKEGIKQKSKKTIFLGALGLVPGVALGAMGAVFLGPIAGGALGIDLARRVARASAGSRIAQGATAQIVARQSQWEVDQRIQAAVDQATAAGEEITPDLITRAVIEHTNNKVKDNRKRTAKLAAATALFGAAGATLGDYLLNNDNLPSIRQAVDTDKDSGEDTGNGQGAGSTDPNTESKESVFEQNVTVESGHGYTHELQDLAATKDVNLTSKEAFQMYEHLEGKFGGDMFVGEGESYRMGNNFGIRRTGSFQWRPEVLQEFEKELRANGKMT